MGKRIMLSVVGAGIGSLAGLLVAFLGAGSGALIAGGAIGAILPQFVLGAPGEVAGTAGPYRVHRQRDYRPYHPYWTMPPGVCGSSVISPKVASYWLTFCCIRFSNALACCGLR